MKNAEEIVSEIRDIAQEGKLRGLAAASFEDVRDAFFKYLYLESEEPVRALMAAVVANRFTDADPVWFFFIAPPSSAKTELLMALDKVPGTYIFSQLTTKTLLSGHQGKGASLLHRVGNGTIFIQKDFTSILSMRNEDRGEIMAQLREVYDGLLVRTFGMANREGKWEGKVGFISGCTLEIENAMMSGSKLGDRFLYYRLPDGDGRKVIDRVTQNSRGGSSGMRASLKETVAGYLEHLHIPALPPDLPAPVLMALRELCIFAVKMRTPVEREQYGSKRMILAVYQHESPARLYKELLTFAGALAVIRGGVWSDEDWTLLSSVVVNSVPSRRFRPVEALYELGVPMLTSALADHLQMPKTTLNYTMEELMSAGIATRRDVPVPGAVEDGEDKKSTYEYVLTDEIRAMLAFRKSLAGIIPPVPAPVLPATEESMF